MNQTMNVKQLERKVFTAYHGDGLFDLYVGILMIVGPIATILRDRGFSGIGSMAVHLLLIGVTCGAYMILKRRITIPRLGRVVFGAKRRERRNKVRLVMALGVSITFSLVAVTIAAMNGIIDGFGDVLGNRILALGILFGLKLAVILSIAAYLLDFNRGYLIAVVLGLGVGGYVAFQQPAAMIAGGLVLAGVGLVYLARFLRANPILEMNGQGGMHGISG